MTAPLAVPLTVAALHALYAACAPLVAPTTLDALVAAESSGNPFAVNINGPITARVQPSTPAAALEVAQAGLRAGYSVDVGLLQVNSRNLTALGLTLPQLLDPCANLRAGSQLLAEAYARAARVHGEGQLALRAAISAYNTGDLTTGFRNGYVGRVTRRARQQRVPALAAPSTAEPSRPDTAATAVFTSTTTSKETTNGNGIP